MKVEIYAKKKERKTRIANRASIRLPSFVDHSVLGSEREKLVRTKNSRGSTEHEIKIVDSKSKNVLDDQDKVSIDLSH